MTQPADPKFFDRVNSQIDHANQLSGEAAPEQVATSFAFAAARYTAWVCFNANKTPAEMVNRREEALKLFTSEYIRMFTENYDEYARNFGKYREKS